MDVYSFVKSLYCQFFYLLFLQAVDDLRSTRKDLEFSLKFLKYAQSNHCSSLSDSSVSYASASLTIRQK